MSEPEYTTPAHNVTEPPKYIVIHHTDIMKGQWPNQLRMVNESHARRGYDLSAYGYNVAYHYFIGSDGTVVHTRPDTDRTMHTRNNAINMESVAIVLAGNFEVEIPNKAQIESLLSLIQSLQAKYHIDTKNVIAHREASPTSCAGKNIMKVIQYYRKKLGNTLGVPEIPPWK